MTEPVDEQAMEVEWVGVQPEDRRVTRDYCKHCGISRGSDVLNYCGACRHKWEVIVFVPEKSNV